MIKEALQYLVGLGEPVRVEVGDRLYSTKKLEHVQDPLADCVNVTSLQGFVDLFNAPIEGFNAADVLIHVDSATSVNLISRKSNKWGDRQRFIRAKYGEGIKGFTFGQWIRPEAFVIGLQMNFVSTPDLQDVIKICSNLGAQGVTVSLDDGVSQEVSVRRGVVLKDSATIKPRQTLAPRRTFPEVDQPPSDFIFRLHSDKEGEPPNCALFEADGGKWQLDAMLNIAFYLRGKVPATVPIVT